MFSRRGQGSMEYMVVSGVALLLVVVLGFFVWESGFLEPEVPRGKTGFYGVEPTDWGASLDDDLLYVVFVNNLDESVHLDNASVTLSSGVVCTGKSLNVDLMPGAKYAVDLDCGFSSSGINLGEYYRADLVVEYTSSSGFPHVSSGEVHGGLEYSIIFSCLPDGCNGVCPLACGGLDDPDCVGDCLDCTCDTDGDCVESCSPGDGCCPGCVPADPDCGPVCVSDGCNGVCPAGCNVADDPDCGCFDGDGCCGIGCTIAVDSDCPPPCVVTCSTGPGCRSNPIEDPVADAHVTGDECCGSDPNHQIRCWECDAGYLWDGGACALICNGVCDGDCPVGCTLAEDPDCGCLDGDLCCGIGCNNAADSDCPVGCVSDGLCDGVCPAGCTVADDPDCGCLDGDLCCGIGCDNAADSDCPPPCVVSCSTGPGCRSSSLAHASVTGDECCGAGSCYACNAGYPWDGSMCSSVGMGAPCEVPTRYTDFECTADGGAVSTGEMVPSGTYVSCDYILDPPGAKIVTRGSLPYISVDRRGDGLCSTGTLDMPVECVVPTSAEMAGMGYGDWSCPSSGSYRESVTCTHSSGGTAEIACTQYGWQVLPDTPGLCKVPWTDPWECVDEVGATLDSLYVEPGDDVSCTTTEHASDGSVTRVEGTCDFGGSGSFVGIGWYCKIPDAASWSCSPYSPGDWLPDGATVDCETNIPVSFDSANGAIRVDQRFSNIECNAVAGTGFDYPTLECRGLSGADLGAIAGEFDPPLVPDDWSCETGFREYMDCTYIPSGKTSTLHCSSYGWKGTLLGSECSHDWDCEANQVCDTVNGYCECEIGYIDCDLDQSTGCEVDARSDDEHCGWCENDCTVNTHASTCVDGICSCFISDVPGWTCTSGYTPGDYLPLGQTTTCTNEANLVRWTLTCGTDSLNPLVECQIPIISGLDLDCGSTEVWVGLGTVTCTDTSTGNRYEADCTAEGWNPWWHLLCGPHAQGATCVCDSGFAACDGSSVDVNGCEVNINTDVNNCGGCASTCPKPSVQGCEGGLCCYDSNACSAYDLCSIISDGDYPHLDICGGSIDCEGCGSHETCYSDICYNDCGPYGPESVWYDHAYCISSFCCCNGTVLGPGVSSCP